ncbi:small GTP-binding protein domain-containing protein [Anabaenopsis circularis NIES-21]|uniref:Small GTP-binding protein domain-containing protein n=1 Tax=Anabaenopsis circularis NIES-21 TaxID=1085406 RepID=A0A1Z4GHY4_9CYAN|nr:small GTP-binding protein domain-containing protein [Anabaenopsis circularis NIES-21]
MVRLKLWQLIILATPIAAIIIFLLVAAGIQINVWGINWIWAVFTVVFVGWRWLLVKWTQPAIVQVEAALAGFKEELETAIDTTASKVGSDATQQAEAALHKILEASINDRPIWEDWQTFWQRCQDVVVAVANIYHPQVQYPLLNIYVPQAYGLIRGTVDDLDQWMQRLSPALNQATVGQAYQAYEVYRKLEPSARKLLRAWGWAQWLLNPVAAVANRATKGSSNRANQQLLVNLGQLLREAALRNLCRQAIALYGGITLANTTAAISPPAIPQTKTQTLREILTQAEPVEEVEQKPISILLVGRTGAGKSSLINTLFQADLVAVDVLPSTDEIQNYHWETPSGESLTLWDTPGYEQVKRGELRQLVLDYATNADLLLLVTPALDPALQMDVDFLADMKGEIDDLPAIAVVTQVDKLRPIREWEPPYNWEWGEKPKEISIREATQYRAEKLEEFSNLIVPVVTSDSKTKRTAWNIDILSLGLIEAIAPAKQLRLARFLRDLDSRTVAAAKIIDHYTFQMATTQGLTSLLKSPVLQFIATMSTGSPTLAYLLAEQIPVEQLPIVIGKLQIAYELFSLLKTDDANKINFDLMALWPLLLENSATPDRNAWAFGHALVEYWTQNLAVEQLRQRFEYYLQQI